jgi:hypothetical protein
MLTPAPIAVASPAKNATCGWCVASATEKIGASVESEPSIRPVMAGWTRWRRNDCAAADSAETSSAAAEAIETSFAVPAPAVFEDSGCFRLAASWGIALRR